MWKGRDERDLEVWANDQGWRRCWSSDLYEDLGVGESGGKFVRRYSRYRLRLKWINRLQQAAAKGVICSVFACYVRYKLDGIFQLHPILIPVQPRFSPHAHRYSPPPCLLAPNQR